MVVLIAYKNTCKNVSIKSSFSYGRLPVFLIKTEAFFFGGGGRGVVVNVQILKINNICVFTVFLSKLSVMS